jgi:hypothetical protein
LFLSLTGGVVAQRRGCDLAGMPASLADQEQRFRQQGMDRVLALDLGQVFDRLPVDDVRR